MKKEKKVRTYQRRTKSGKTITVRAHTASYEAAEKAKEAAKKKGAGDEIVERKKKNWELPMDEFLKKLKDERAQKREDEESKKVEDEKPKKKSEKTEKKTSAKKTTKKRTVGTGTNGPEPKKKKSEGKETKVDKQTKAWFNYSPSSFSKVKVSKDNKYGGWRIDLSDGSGQVYDSKEAAQKDAKLLRGMYKEWKGSSKRTNGSTPIKTSMKTTSASASSPAFTAAEFKEWYRGTGSAADKKVAKALRAQLGRSGYRKFEDEAIDNYTSRGHLSMFKRVSGGSSTDTTEKKNSSSKKLSVGTGTNGPEPKKKSNAGSSKMFRGVFSDNFGTVDKVVRNVVTSDLPKLRTLPKGIAQWHEYSLGGDVNDHSVAISNAKKVLERMPEKMYNRAYKEWKASMNGSNSKK